MNRRKLMFFLVLLLLAVSVGTAAAQTSQALWFVHYYDNRDLKGDPLYSSSEGVINHDWGTRSPAPNVPNDDWSARWTSFVDFAAGTYRFTVTSDDGVRVYLGDKHIIQDWKKHPPRTSVATVSLNGGSYAMAVDYFEAEGHAQLKLGWERIGAPSPGTTDVTILSSASAAPPPAPMSTATWYASYWNNMDQAGNPLVGRNETKINYNWGSGSPVKGINSDKWSARWTSYITFEPGTYRFTTVSDDGIKVFVNDRHVINNWTLHPSRTDTGVITLAGGTYPVAVDYFDQVGQAEARLWWERIAPSSAPVSSSGVTATPWTYLRLRSGPGTAYGILYVVAPGTSLPVVGRTDDGRWVEVQYRGVTGWMGAGYLKVVGDMNTVPVG